jgi:S1-C subfamily serine protease
MRETVDTQRFVERPLAKASLASWPSNIPPPRLGISWREDDGEPNSVLITRIVEGTPAAATGLAVRDRIYELNDQPFASAAAFETAIMSLLDTNPSEFTLLVERRGHLRTVTVKMQSGPEAKAGEQAFATPDSGP